MNKPLTHASLFNLMMSLFSTALLFAVLQFLANHGFQEITDVILKRGPGPMLSVFFGIYCGLMIAHAARHTRQFMTSFRLLLFYSFFPLIVGLTSSIVIQKNFNSRAPVVELNDASRSNEQEKIWQPFYVGSLISLLDIFALLAVYQQKQKKRMAV